MATLAAVTMLCLAVCTTAGAALPTALSAAGLRNPAGMVQSLRELELETLYDIRQLDSGERAEMFVSLHGVGVGLGSRSKLRQLAEGINESTDRLYGMRIPDDSGEAFRALQDDKGGGISGDVCLESTLLPCASMSFF